MNRLDELIEIHGKLANRIKRYEQAIGDFPVEVNNEFRYAARSALHMAALLDKYDGRDALEASLEDARRFDHFFQQAEHALRCAYHDLVDGLVHELTILLDEATEGLSDSAIEAMGDFRTEVLDDLEACNELIAQSRENLDERDGLYDKIYEEWFDRLLDHKKTLTESAVPKMIEVQREIERERTELLLMQEEQAALAAKRHQRIVALSILGLLLTTILSLVALILGG